MRICGDKLAVATEEGLYISVWNWKSGEHISDFVSSFILNEMMSHSPDRHAPPDGIAADARLCLSR
jgi:hypothetical protein